MVYPGTGWGAESLMFKTVCNIMAYPKKEKASPFASWVLVNNKEYNAIIWG